MKSQLTFVHALSPLHAGIGQGAGVIDMPIAREKATNLPFLPGSSIKGALRTRLLQDDTMKKYKDIFGSDPTDSVQMRASSVLFSDQRLLLLPVRSIAGTFAWVTSPYILQRFMRELAEVEEANTAPKTVPVMDDYGVCYLTQSGKAALAIKNTVYLEDVDLKVQESAPGTSTLAEWATWLSERLFQGVEKGFWQPLFTARLCLVHDDVFHFMSQHTTEITARIRLEESSKTVTSGGLWYEEALPAETILTGIAVITPVKDVSLPDTEIAQGLQKLTKKTIQFGGKATVGRGVCRVRLV